MDIHEYQAKEILARFGVPVPRGGLAYSPEQASYRCTELGGAAWVVKAQVHTGGRGEAGGVKLCQSDREVQDVANQMFGRRLVTRQSGPRGKLIYRVYVEEATEIARELYFGIVLDRSIERVVITASGQGGVAIEELAASEPDAIVRAVIEPAVGFLEFQAREIAFAIGLAPAQIAEASRIFRRAYRAFRDLDGTLLEINPLAVTGKGSLVALDAKMSFDDNALFRHLDVSELRDRSQEDTRESHAADRGLAYVGLDGNIGCMINGAGLAMATMDMIKLVGGEPANFLDIGGGASPERVLKAFRAVLQDDNVEAMLINIFAGINRCDWVAQGIVAAFKEIDVKIPVVVRLAGTHVDQGRQILHDSKLPIIGADSLAEAAEKVVAQVRGREMSILVNADTRVLVQGITGRIGRFHAEEMIDYGTDVVGGVTPGKGGEELLDRPIFNTMREAIAATGADASIVFVPPPFAADSIMEAADAGIRYCVCITDGIPSQDMMRVKRYMRRYRAANRMTLTGPNCAGTITPGECMLGIMPGHIYLPGRVGVISRSGTLGYEAASQLKPLGIGVSTAVGIGGDPVNGSNFRDHLERFQADPDTDLVMMIGEIGGPQEVEGAQYVREHMSKPVVAYIAGMTAPKGRQMGHAGAIVSGSGDSAQEKVEVLRSAGITVAANPSSMGETVARVMAEHGLTTTTV